MAIFAKAPVAGRVKTRLAPVLGTREAADLAEALLLDTVGVVERARFEAVVAFSPAAGRRDLEVLLGRRRRLVAQGGGDLGARLERVLGPIVRERHRPVIAVGTDCPDLTPARLDEARQALVHSEIVLGPALDGGFYLLAQRRHRPELFTDIPWSTDQTGAAVEARAHALGASLARLEPARDLDTPEDLFEWYARAQEAYLREVYPRTSALLHALLPPRRLSRLEGAIRGEIL